MDPQASSDCEPLSLTRSIAEFPIGNIPLWQHQKIAVANAGLANEGISLHPHAWLAMLDLTTLTGAIDTLVDAFLVPLAWRGTTPDPTRAVAATGSFIIRHPWDFLRANEAYVAGLQKSELLGEVHSSAVLEGIVHLGVGSRILPGVFIEGNVVVGAKCRIGPNCYIRGHTSIGDACHIGQSVEVKNSLILSRTNVGHLSYVGDSILGEAVNFGAGTIISNFRHDGKNHRSMVGGELLDTGRRKFGAIVGDHVHTGIHTSIYPGRKLWPNTSTRPGEIVQRDLRA